MVRLDFSVNYLNTIPNGRGDGQIVCTTEFTAELVGVDCEGTRSLFDGQYIGIDFGPRCESDRLPTVGHIEYMENSSGTDGGVSISINADGLLPVLVEACSSRTGDDYDFGQDPFADVRIWFSLFERDGPHGERLLDNLLDDPTTRPLHRVEIWVRPC